MNAASIKDRLKNVQKITNKNYQNLLISYSIERTIYRISISEYKEKFILKGGVLLYAMKKGNYPRITTDIDFLANEISNNLKEMKEVFTKIFSIKLDDPLFYDLESLEVRKITEFKEYYGVNISINSYLDRTKIPVKIDVGFGDSTFPEKILLEFPTLINNETPKIYAYSIYTAIAEKFEALVSLGLNNSRYKDFYDLYTLTSGYNLDGELLRKTIMETFSYRETKLNVILAFEDDFVENLENIQRWNAFIKKKKVIEQISFDEVMARIKQVFIPLLEQIKKNEEFKYSWNSQNLKWE